jgi:hypothetical protein
MDKGIIIGAEHEAATRMNLSFVMFRHATSVGLFSDHLRIYLPGLSPIFFCTMSSVITWNPGK